MSLSSQVVGGKSKRTDFPLDLSKTALVIIDIQACLSSEESETVASQDAQQNNYLYKTALPEAVSNIQQLAQVLRKHRDVNDINRYGCEVIFTYLQALTDDCRDVSLDYKLSGPKLAVLPGPTNPAQFLPELQPQTNDVLLPKTSCSVFQSTNLAYVLRNLQIEQVLVCGQLTDQCVESAVRDGADLGFFMTVVEDGCAAMSVNEHQKGLHGMKGFARILSTLDVLKEIENGVQEYYQGSNLQSVPTATRTVPTEQQPQTTTIATIVQPIENFQSLPPDPSSTTALLRALKFASVKFLRYTAIDINNNIRCKAKPLSTLSTVLTNQVAIAEACFAGMPRYADAPLAASNLSAARSLIVQPDLNTLRVLPYARRTAMCLGYAHDPTTGHLSPFCTRGLLARVLQTAKDRLGLVFNIGAELEFQLFRKDGQPVDASLFADSTTLNEQESFLDDLMQQLQTQDIAIELVHAESANGQLEIVLPYQNDPLAVADSVVLAQETIRAVAKAHAMKALFLPKTNPMQAGSGLHLHFSFCDAFGSTTNLFPGEAGSLLSPMGESFVEGILQHLPGLLALTMGSTNSFRRVGAGCWTGHDVRWATEDKEAPIRICREITTQRATHGELKLIDSTANIYMAMAGLLAAGMHGIEQKSKLRPESAGPNGESTCPKLPGSMEESLGYLEIDSYLTGVLGKELSTAYLAVKKEEAQRYSEMSLGEEVAEALSKA